jgi:antirestriction protein ArdC
MEKTSRYRSKKISKDEMNAISEKVDKRFEEFLKLGKYKEVLLVMGNLSRYSLKNQLYLMWQKPEVTTVHGLREWNKLGRQVKRGEKGLKIYFPLRGKQEGETGEEIRCYGFKAGYVFDLSQTEGEELSVFRFDEKALVKDKEKILNGLSEAASNYGYSIRRVGEIELGQDCYGLCSHRDKEILIKENLGDLQEISTTIHECGHALAHGSCRSDFQGLTPMEKREIKEVEAESIACIVCTYLGIETENFNFSYISGWAKGDISKFRKNLNVVSGCAKTIIESIENEFEGQFMGGKMQI